MKKILLGTVALIALGGVAQAADLPARTYVKAPPVPVFDWSGFYVGAYAGVGASDSGRMADPTSPTNGRVEQVGYGFTGGGTVGYNWQLGEALFGTKWVVGLEGDFGYLGTSRRGVDFDDPSLAFNTKTSWIATARARVGVSSGPNLTYVTGGFAAINTRDIVGDTVTGFDAGSSKTLSGYVIGTGTETMLGGGWSAKAESLYVDTGSGDAVFNPANGFLLQADKHRYQIQRFGLNYNFGMKTGALPQVNWSGFYAGINGGTAVASTEGNAFNGTFPGNINVSDNSFSVSGVAGYNWMLSPRFVAGVEGDIGYLGFDHSNMNFNNSAVTGSKTSWIATARARLGYSTGPALLYVTGGGAWVNVTDSFDWGTPTSSKKTLSGWTLGGGIETMLWGNWATKSEYLFVDAGKGDILTDFGTVQIDHKYHLFRSALVYRFNNDPIVAKY